MTLQDPADLVERLIESANRLGEGPQGFFRCEDIISASAAFAGECQLRKTAGFDFEHHSFTPGQPIFSDTINRLLSGDVTNWDDIPVTSAFGAIHNVLTHIPKSPWNPELFPDVAKIYQSYAASRGGKTTKQDWGQAPLSVPPDHAPRLPPLRAAFDLRSAARRAVPGATADDLATASLLSLIKILVTLRGKLDDSIAITMALETMNAMAKTVPVLQRHLDEFARSAAQAN